MSKDYPREIPFSFKEFNNKCRENGLRPFPFESMKIEIQDEHHLTLATKMLEKHLTEWWAEEGHKKQ